MRLIVTIAPAMHIACMRLALLPLPHVPSRAHTVEAAPPNGDDEAHGNAPELGQAPDPPSEQAPASSAQHLPNRPDDEKYAARRQRMRFGGGGSWPIRQEVTGGYFMYLCHAVIYGQCVIV
jgi:hypothetical protein